MSPVITVPRRTAMSIGAASALAVILAGCGPTISKSSSSDNANQLQEPKDGEAEGEIVIWDRSGDLFEVFDNAIKAFNKKYPKITVKHEAVDIDAKLQNTLITGTDVPDGVFLDDAKVGQFVDHLWDLSGLLEPYAAQISPQKLDVNRSADGIFGIPFDLDPGLLFYNAEALEKAGVDPASIETYDDLLDAAREYKKAVPEAKPIHLEQGAFLAQLQLEMFANQLGTSLADDQGKLRLDSDEYRKVLTFLDTVNKEQLGTRAEYLGPTDVAEMDASREVFYPWAIWFSFAPAQMLKETNGAWRAMLLPAWEKGGARGGAMGGSSFILPKAGKNSSLAWLFYEFLMFDPAGYQAVWGSSSVYPDGLMTSIPSYLPAADPDKPLFTPVESLGKQDLWKVAAEAGSQIPGTAPIPSWWGAAADYLGNDIQKMYDGSLSVDELISQATSDIQTNLVDRQ